MLKETYVGNVKNLPIDCIREYVNNKTLLAPSQTLKRLAGVEKNADGTKNTKMDYDQYCQLYKKEILDNPKAMKRIRFLKRVADLFDVYLICYCKNFNDCHRKPLMEIFNEIELDKKGETLS